MQLSGRCTQTISVLGFSSGQLAAMSSSGRRGTGVPWTAGSWRVLRGALPPLPARVPAGLRLPPSPRTSTRAGETTPVSRSGTIVSGAGQPAAAALRVSVSTPMPPRSEASTSSQPSTRTRPHLLEEMAASPRHVPPRSRSRQSPKTSRAPSPRSPPAPRLSSTADHRPQRLPGTASPLPRGECRSPS